jgi:hypothetical protein
MFQKTFFRYIITGVLVHLLFCVSLVWADQEFDTLEYSLASKKADLLSAQQGMYKGMEQFGLTFGGGLGDTMWGTNENHDLILGSVHYGQILTEEQAKDTWYRGNWELMGEFVGAWQVNPNDSYFIGILPMLRYNFTVWGRAVPFLNIGAGIAYTDIGEPDLSTHFQFNSQVGCGIHYFITADFAMTWQYRLLHISNAGIEEPNDGVNTHLFLLGLNWFY